MTNPEFVLILHVKAAMHLQTCTGKLTVGSVFICTGQQELFLQLKPFRTWSPLLPEGLPPIEAACCSCSRVVHEWSYFRSCLKTSIEFMRNSIRACYDFIRSVPKSNCKWTHTSDSQHSKAILHLGCTADDAELHLFKFENEMIKSCQGRQVCRRTAVKCIIFYGISCLHCKMMEILIRLW